jgi:hypothetical protein
MIENANRANTYPLRYFFDLLLLEHTALYNQVADSVMMIPASSGSKVATEIFMFDIMDRALSTNESFPGRYIGII